MTQRDILKEQIEAAWRDPAREHLRQKIRACEWTGHNLPVGPDEATISADIGLIGDDPRTIIIKSEIGRTVRARRPRVLDLGSLEGGLSFEMARAGCDVVGVEARAENVAKAELIREYYDVPHLRYEVRDVKTLDVATDGQFDAILCCGILYHLDDPFGFLRRLSTLVAPGGFLFIDTHYAPLDRDFDAATHRELLSPLTTVDYEGNSYEGRWHEEPRDGDLRRQLWTATSNDRSFWPTHDALVRGAYHAGFQSISELYGMYEIDREFGLRKEFSRTYLCCRARWE